MGVYRDYGKVNGIRASGFRDLGFRIRVCVGVALGVSKIRARWLEDSYKAFGALVEDFCSEEHSERVESAKPTNAFALWLCDMMSARASVLFWGFQTRAHKDFLLAGDCDYEAASKEECAGWFMINVCDTSLSLLIL